MRRALMHVLIVVGAVLAVSAVPASAMDMSRAVAQLYADVSAYPPKPGQLTVCYGLMCRRRMEFAFTSGDRGALTGIMAAGKSSAAAERAAVQKAVIWFDRRLGPILGTNKRVANADFRAKDVTTNFDCWDTTRNISGLLVIMQDWGLLKHHRVGDPRYRGNPLIGQTPHNTPVLVDRSNVEWVVDLWTRGYGEAPEVMTADVWVKRD
ncbi:hypothetical protein [Bradyrhizobium prioriisuperbiae]|uniref:hypothetical protein n=1 Tax=Bradyrhizobium prioriisuperbiae TaxID=2854389 RepID=UPI0028E7BC7C|nr:hypothetical protein [Bradyrhizobium prioritasuperba]